MKTERISINELLKTGKQQEIGGDYTGAIKSYTTVIGKDVLHTGAYNRLMILFRRQKDYKKEVAIIKKAISAYEKDIQQDLQTWKNEHSVSVDLSHTLAQVLGLVKDNGLPTYEEPQVIVWRKRLENLERKM